MSQTKPLSFADRLMSRPYVLLVLTNLFWGGNVVAGKAAVGQIDPYALMLLRWVGALLLVLPFAIRPLKQDWPTIRAKWWLYLFYGIVGYATFNVLVYVAAHFTSGVNNAIDQVTINILVMLFNFHPVPHPSPRPATGGRCCHHHRRRPHRHPWRPQPDPRPRRQFRRPAGSLCLARLRHLFSDPALAAKEQLAEFSGRDLHWRCPGLDRLSIDARRRRRPFHRGRPGITPLGWLVVAYTVLFPSLVSQMFYVRGVELIGPNRASLFINLIPLFGALGSVVILGEKLQNFHIVAGLLIIIGIGLAEWSARRA